VQQQFISQTYSFKVGTFSCTVIQDEDGHPTLKELFGDVEDAVMQQRIADNPDATEHLSYNPLLIDTGQQKILIDSGHGEHTGGDGRLMPNLRSIGVQAEEIGIVVLTHAHLDHYMGMLTPQGTKVFPNATYMMWHDEWTYTTHPDQLTTSFERARNVGIHPALSAAPLPTPHFPRHRSSPDRTRSPGSVCSRSYDAPHCG
jgi:glyoxylase-like metal-dependent hydrolase (beta-lactamase superfamily II)